MLKCEQLMQEDFLKMTENKEYRLGHFEELSRIAVFSFIKNLNKTLKEPDTFVKHVKYDYVVLYTIWAKREDKRVKLVDFAVSIDIDEENNIYKVSDCYATAWLDKKED